jgi:hypothetical protein
MGISTKEAVKLTGYSESWLKRHECGWCGQIALYAVKYGCCAIYEKCDTVARFKKAAAQPEPKSVE